MNYTVVANPVGDQGLTYEQVHIPLQELLAERLHLAAHTTMAPVPGYKFAAAKNGAKLTPAKGEGEPFAYILIHAIKAHSLTLEQFASAVSTVVEEPVKDSTEIQGKFDFDLQFARLNEQDSDKPSPFTGLEEQNGLKLVTSKVDVLSLFVDHVDLTPAQN